MKQFGTHSYWQRVERAARTIEKEIETEKRDKPWPGGSVDVVIRVPVALAHVFDCVEGYRSREDALGAFVRDSFARAVDRANRRQSRVRTRCLLTWAISLGRSAGNTPT